MCESPFVYMKQNNQNITDPQLLAQHSQHYLFITWLFMAKHYSVCHRHYLEVFMFTYAHPIHLLWWQAHTQVHNAVRKNTEPATRRLLIKVEFTCIVDTLSRLVTDSARTVSQLMSLWNFVMKELGAPSTNAAEKDWVKTLILKVKCGEIEMELFLLFFKVQLAEKY